MAVVLAAVLEGRPIGEVERQPNGTLRFNYAHEYGTEASDTPLSVSMSTRDRVHGDVRITPWLWGLLPDNGDVLGRWGRQFSVSVSSPYPLLSTPVGHDCAGAVQFCRPDAVDRLLAQPGDLTEMSEADVALRLRTLRADSTAWLGPGFTGQFSWLARRRRQRWPSSMAPGQYHPAPHRRRTFSNPRSLGSKRNTSTNICA